MKYGAERLLQKYTSLICNESMKLFGVLSELVSTYPKQFYSFINILFSSTIGVLLPSFITNLVLMQVKEVVSVVFTCM